MIQYRRVGFFDSRIRIFNQSAPCGRHKRRFGAGGFMANGKLVIPETKTPGSVYVGLLSIAVVVGISYCWFLGTFWGVALALATLAFTTQIYTIGVGEFKAQTILNSFSGNQRVVFQGRSAKLPWESAGTLVDLKAEIKDIPEETWATKDGALMDVKYVYMLHPAATEEGILTYASFTDDGVKTKAHNVFTRVLSSYFGKCKDCTNLLDKEKVNVAVFSNPAVIQTIKDLELECGVIANAYLEDVDYDEATQEARDTITNTKSYDASVDILMKTRPDGTPGMSRPDAEKLVKLANFKNNVSEEIKDWNLKVDAPDMKNMTSFSIVGMPPTSGGGKGGKK
jgi:hypothetical protein